MLDVDLALLDETGSESLGRGPHREVGDTRDATQESGSDMPLEAWAPRPKRDDFMVAAPKKGMDRVVRDEGARHPWAGGRRRQGFRRAWQDC